MGAEFSFATKPLPEGAIAKIVHDKFSYTAGTDDTPIPSDLLKLGEHVKVIKSGTLYQSRDYGDPISYTKVMFRSGKHDVYLTVNLKPV